MAVAFRRAVLECAGQRGQEVGRFVEEGFGALGYELWRGRGRVGEDCREGGDRIGRGDAYYRLDCRRHRGDMGEDMGGIGEQLELRLVQPKY